jgi:esterase/lipase superfamily enzyme
MRADGKSRDPIADLFLEKCVVFLLHGYNVNFNDGKDKLLQFAERLPSMKDAALVATLWPGDHWVGPFSYPFEWRDARDTSAQLVRFIGDNLRRDVPLSFVTHSLGARVAMDTVRTIYQIGFRIEQVCLMAPAIDDDSLSDVRVYRRATNHSRRVSVLSSVEDEALKFAYPVGDLLHTLFYRGESWDQALGYHGPMPESEFHQPVPENVYHVAIPPSRGADHGDYLPDKNPNDEQKSAAFFANAALKGVESPRYILL